MTATVGCDTWEDHINASATATATADTGRCTPRRIATWTADSRLREVADAAGQRCC